MVAVNWTTLVLLLMGLFALAGFFKGWWKEAITTVFLAVLVFLLQLPEVAGFIIGGINGIIAAIWSILPLPVIDFLEAALGLGAEGQPPFIDAGSAQTWLVILIIFIGLAILVGRLGLPGSTRNAAKFSGYVVTWPGRLLGAILGAVNAWLIVGLVRAYLDGSRLPGNEESAMQMMGSAATAAPASDVMIQAVDVPAASILDSFLPWLFAGIGIAVLIAALKSRYGVHEQQGYRKVAYKAPPGYKKAKVERV